MNTRTKIGVVAGLIVLVGILMVVGDKVSAPHVAIVSPQESLETETSSQKDLPEKKPQALDRAVAPQTKQITTPAPKEIVLDLSSDFARTYEKELTPFLQNPADFNEHYVVARWSCGGGGCIRTGVIDKKNGRAYIAPSDVYGSRTPAPFVPYTLGSNLFRVVNNEVIDVYRFESGRFFLENIEQL